MIGYSEIEEQWLLGNATPMSAQQSETAFRWCAEKFGREWLQPTHPGRLVTDAYVVAAVWDAGSRAESLRGADRLIRKLGTSISDVDWAVLAELCAAAHFASSGAKVVLEQDIQLEVSRRKPDLHVQLPVDGFHVEVTCPEKGREYLRLMELLRLPSNRSPSTIGTLRSTSTKSRLSQKEQQFVSSFMLATNHRSRVTSMESRRYFSTSRQTKASAPSRQP